MQADFQEGRPPAIPDYTLLRIIGRGAYGEVWMVQGVTGLLRAAKVVWRDRFSDSTPFEREFRAIRLYSEVSLDDPRLLRVLHVGRNDAAGHFYYVMELADSWPSPVDKDEAVAQPIRYEPHTLRQDLDQRKRFPLGDAVRITADLCRALQSLHHRGLIHRDVKPSNILFIGGIPKLGDVGLVTDIREGATRVGTFGYLPPETDEPIQPATDIYALGKVLYELVTGNPATECPRIPREEIPSAERSQWLEINEIILKATEPRALRRYSSAQELLRDLLQVESGQSIRGWLRLRRQARWLRAAALVLLAISLIAAAIAETQRRLTAKAVERLEQARYSAAQTRIAAGRHRDARAFLEEIRTDSKGTVTPEWSLLYGLAFGDPDQVYPGPGESVLQIVTDATASRLAARTQSQGLWLWDGKSTFGNPDSHKTLGLGPFPTADKLPLRLTGFSTSNRLEGLPGATGSWSLFSWNQGSPWLVVSSDPAQRLLEVRSSTTFKLHSQLQLPSEYTNYTIRSEAISQDGAWLTFLRTPGNQDDAPCFIEQWSTETRSFALRCPIQKTTQQASFSPDHRRAVVAFGTTGAPLLYDLQSGRSNRLSECQLQRGCNVVAFSPDGTMVACGGTDGIVRLWNAFDGQFIESLTGHSPAITALSWSQDGQWLFSGDLMGEIRRWAVRSDARIATRLPGFWNGSFGDFCLGTASPHWAATLANGTVGVWDSPQQRRPRWILTNAFEPITFSAGDSVLWTYDKSAWVRSWNLHTGKVILESGPIVPAQTRIRRITVDPTNAIAFAINYDDATIYRWNLRTHRMEATATNDFSSAYMLQYAPQSDLLVALRENDAIYGWNGKDLSRRFLIPGSTNADAANGIVLSPNGRWIATGKQDGGVRILDVQRGTIHQTIHHQTSPVLAVTFTPDSAAIVSSHQSGVISWTDLKAGRERIQIDTSVHQGGALRGEIFRIGFSADGQMLVALTNGGEDTSELLRWVARNPIQPFGSR